jgi:hypothetical protein
MNRPAFTWSDPNNLPRQAISTPMGRLPNPRRVVADAINARGLDAHLTNAFEHLLTDMGMTNADFAVYMDRFGRSGGTVIADDWLRVFSGPYNNLVPGHLRRELAEILARAVNP